jgi:hypothetical protein
MPLHPSFLLLVNLHFLDRTMIVVFVLEMEMACLFVDRWDCCVGDQLSVDIDWDGRGKVTLKNSDRWRYVGWFLRLHSEF